MNRTVILSAFLWLTAGASLPAFSSQGVLTGDVRLACEAVLCLSSGTRPGECAPSLSRYFGINKKFWSDTVRARRNFLQLCPTSGETGMPDLVNAIANGAGRCDAAYLNKFLYEEKSVLECRSRGKEEDCNRIIYYRIKNKLPNYCRAYINHEWTDLNNTLHYQGSKEWVRKNAIFGRGKNKQGGKWVD